MRKKKLLKKNPTTITREAIRQQSGKSLPTSRTITILKRTHYYVVTRPIMGDAPKNFIYVYEFGHGHCRRAKPKTWIPYIAKIGHKWYPNESITEYLMVRIGEVLNLKMAKARLAILNGQLRFLSQFFLTQKEVLNHGAELFSNYLSDPELIALIGIRKEEQNWFTFQFIETAMQANFGAQAADFIQDFVQLLAFDALTGNNDRHHYNWGIITATEDDAYLPRFAPIYDTARGLFWSTSDAQIQNWMQHPKQLPARIQKYAEGAKPQTGWDNQTNINHFQLMEHLAQDTRFRAILHQMYTPSNLQRIFQVLENEFSDLMNLQRRNLIQNYLQYRFDKLYTIMIQSKNPK
ncbi:MAG: hypothetical protein RLZZ628_272 [Bacteroidota bacterium]|jgi:hypothetical protein